MREIKFRVWDNMENTLEIVGKDIYDRWPNDYLMQYIWLKDKNWVEIYEWDILMQERYWKKLYYYVIYEWCYFAFKSIKKENNELSNVWCITISEQSSSYEIIWNIYENKNLFFLTI